VFKSTLPELLCRGPPKPEDISRTVPFRNAEFMRFVVEIAEQCCVARHPELYGVRPLGGKHGWM
jgi:hypothetical protein